MLRKTLTCLALPFIIAFACFNLRPAAAATCYVPGDYSTIQAAVGESTCDTINLMPNAVYEQNITINRTVTIQGQGAASTAMNGTASGNVFIIEPDAVVTLSDMTIRGGATDAAGRGGGILSFGSLTLNNVVVTGNEAYNGGGIAADGGTMVVNNSTICHNSTTGNSGAGIISMVSITLTNTTISDNRTTGPDRVGGGLAVFAGVVTMINCTISNNSATGYGGGLYVSPYPLPGTDEPPPVVHALNTIIANNTASAGGTDCYGKITSQDYNLIESTDGCTITGTTTHNIIGRDPNLGALQDNGGTTWTRELLYGSPAIDAGSSPNVTSDQRGFPRPVDLSGISNADDGCDIGAFEAQAKPKPGMPWLPMLLDD